MRANSSASERPLSGPPEFLQFRASDWRDQAGLAVAVLSGTIFYLFHFIDLIPGSEFQDWVIRDLNGAFVWEKLSHSLLRNGIYFSRDLSMLYVQTIGTACGPNIPCLNLAVFLPISLSAGLLYIFGRNLGLAPALAGSAVIFWWFSAPTAAVVGWQATINDRLALLFILITLINAVHYVNKKTDTKTILASNLATGIPLFLAYNCKEASFFLGPLLLLLLFLFRKGDLKRRFRGLALISLPIVYATYHNLRYFLFQLPNSPGWRDYVTSSPLFENLERFFLGMISALPGQGGLLSIGMLLALVAGALVALQLKNSPRTFMKENGSILVTLAGFLGAFLIPLRARPEALFYMYIPLAFFSLTVFLALNPWSRRRPRTGSWKSAEAAVLIVLLSIQFVRFEKKLIAWHIDNVTFSRNFISGLHTLHHHVPAAQLESVVLVRPPQPRHYHKFCPTTERRSIWRYTLGSEDLAEIGSGPVRTQYASLEDQRELQVSPGSEDMAFFDDAMRLVALRSNDQLIRFQPEESSP